MAGGFGAAPAIGSLAGGGGGLLGALGTAAPIIGAAASLVPAIYKTITGIGQARRGRRMNPINPGFTMNTGIIDNARILGERANNYQIPGYSQIQNNQQAGYASAFNQGVQGASSGADVLDLASKMSYNQGQNINQLGIQNAQGQQQAQMQALDANAQAGQQYQDRNAYDRSIYQGQLNEKAALIQGGNENIYGGLDQIGSVAGAMLNPKKAQMDFSSMTPDQINALIKQYQG